MTIVNGWKLSTIVIKSSILDIGKVSGSTTGREWTNALDWKLKFTMLSITYLKREREGKHQIYKTLAPIKNLEIYFNSTHSFLLEHLSPNYSKVLLEN